jgi:hypothetical protein
MRFELPELDYHILMQALSGYSYPRDRVTRLLRSGGLIRVKKGLYVTNDPRDWYSKEVLANLVYGPSYVSLEYALRFHGLIPEAVETVTSVTTQRHKRYDTPLGRFEYEHLPERMYSCGIVYLSADTRRGFFIASPEKALIDTLALRTPGLKPADIENHLFENLRIDEADFSRLDFSLIKAMLSDCARPSVRSFFVFLKRRLSL